ncbi:reverse transcriptase domain-containing protein [Tanacetum coccineum]
MDDEPIWAAVHVVALTPGSAITIPETANEFSIKGNHLTLVKGNQFYGRTKIDPHKHIHEFLGICDMFKYRDTEYEFVRLMMFPLSLTGEAKTWLDELNEGTIETWDELRTSFISRFFPLSSFRLTPRRNPSFLSTRKRISNRRLVSYEGNAQKLSWSQSVQRQHYQNLLSWSKQNNLRSSSNSNTDKIMARMDAMTLKMDAQYKELQNHAKKTKPDLDEDDIPMSREEEAKFMQTFCKTRFYNDYRDRDSNRDNWRSNERSSYNRDNYRSNTDDKPYDLQKQFNDFMKSQQSTNAFFDRLADKQSGRPSRSLPSNTQPNPKGHNSKVYQPPQSRNEHVNAVFTRSGKSYNPPVNSNDQQTNPENPINFDNSDEEDEEPTPQPKIQNPKPVKETTLPKPYKPKIPYP